MISIKGRPKIRAGGSKTKSKNRGRTRTKTKQKIYTEKRREKQRNNHCVRSCRKRTTQKSVKINPASVFIISKAAGKRKQTVDTEAKESRRRSRGEEVVSASQSFAIVSIASGRTGKRPLLLALFVNWHLHCASEF